MKMRSRGLYELLKEGQSILLNTDIEISKTASIDAEILLAAAMKRDKIFLSLNPQYLISDSEKLSFEAFLRERAKGKPVSKILGEKEFFSLKFLVTEDVLDPRPDSEILIEKISKIFASNIPLKILDIGTGSGCLSISLLTLFPLAKALAIDISSKALSIAKANAELHSLEQRIEFKQADIFLGLDQLESSKTASEKQFDLIISNPPYIKSSDIKNLMIDVKNYDPLIALDGGSDGLDFYRFIANQAWQFLKPDALLILEIGFDQRNDVKEIFLAEKKYHLNFFDKDYAGNDRIMGFSLANNFTSSL